MRILIPFLMLIVLFGCNSSKNTATETMEKTEYAKQSIHQFQVADINGETFDFGKLKGKKIMIVNTASKCGLTAQYRDLQELYNKFKDDGFVIIGFPANNFLGQEPGSNEKIKTFCEQKFGVTFPMMAKISVKGKEIHPIYRFLTEKEKNGVADSKVSWNFQKYLLDENGYLIKHVSPKTGPMSDDILSWIKGAG